MRAWEAAGAALLAALLGGCGSSDPNPFVVDGRQVGGELERCPKSLITRFEEKDFSSSRWQRPMMNYQLAGCDINGQVPGAPDNEPWWDTMDFWIYEAPGALSNPDPMLVFYLHGTSQTPIDAALGVGWNELAEREDIIVVYPHGREDGGNNNWEWGEASAFGKVGQLESVSQITTAVQALYGIGPDRTFIAGTSSGGISATMLAALYVDQYTAVMSVIAGSYNLSDPDGTQAYMAMGDKAKVMPAFLIHATADHLFPQTASREADTQWAGTNDRADNGSADGSISQTPEIDDTYMNPEQGEPQPDECLERQQNNPCPSYPLGYETYPYEIHRYRDEFGAGKVIVEGWYLQGMAHNYPYGNPEGNFTDPAGPDVTTAGYLFFREILARQD